MRMMKAIAKDRNHCMGGRLSVNALFDVYGLLKEIRLTTCLANTIVQSGSHAS